MTWLLKAWRWFGKHWKSVLLGVSTLGLGLLVGKALRKTPKLKVVNPEALEAEKERQAAQEEEDEARAEAGVVRDVEVWEAEDSHRLALEGLTDEQRSRVEELGADPDALNEYLLGTGKEVRGD